MKRLFGILILAAWPVAFVGGILWENRVCGWPRGLWQDAVCKAPTSARAHANLASVYERRGQLNLAIRHYEIAEELARGDARLQYMDVGARALSNIAVIHLEYGGAAMLDEADRVLEVARNRYPTSELVVGNSVEVFIRLGEWERAELFIEAALKEFPNSPFLMAQRAEVHSMFGQCRQREFWLRKAEQLDPLAAFEAKEAGIPIYGTRPCCWAVSELTEGF